MKKLLTISIATLFAVLLAACGSKLDGTYHATSGLTGMTLTFKSDGTVSTRAFQGDMSTTYKIDGDKITFRFPGGDNVVLTQNKDGSLEGIMGKFSK